MPDTKSVRIIDISMPVFPQMPTFPGDPEVEFEPFMAMDYGDMVNLTKIHIGTHAGTHIDAPHHILNNNVKIDNLPLETFYGPAQVVEISEECQLIDDRILKKFNLSTCSRLLLKTGNSLLLQSNSDNFVENYTGLTVDGATYLVASGIKLIGIDYLSLEPFKSEGLKAHKILLENNIVILEGINLSLVTTGKYTLSAFPIKYKGLDAAPVRAVLLK